MKDNGAGAHSNSNPLIALLAGDDGTFTADQQ
jgi:hypothetical protein